MAFVAVAAVFAFLVLFILLVTSFGHRFARLLIGDSTPPEELLLFSLALGVIACELLLFLAEVSQHIYLGIVLIAAGVVITSAGEFSLVWREVVAILRRFSDAAKTTKLICLAIAVVSLTEFTAAMAPLTGSDALHYHFAAPLEILRRGFHPDFFLSHSFFSGQGHLLILLGLALGSEQIAMALIFLAAVMSAAAAACLAWRWMNATWAGAAALIFLLTPVIFWQASIAGAPDLWMAFFTTAGVLAITQSSQANPWRHAVVAGLLAGAVAGTKYTGCLVAFALAVAFLIESRSLGRLGAFVAAALAAGVWPYLRNLAWTGDPVFPFLMLRLHPERVNHYALASYLSDTGAGASHTFWQILKFPFFGWIDLERLGFWQFYGPLILAFSPLLVWAIFRTKLRDQRAWRVALIVWAVSGVGINITSNMTRFLLPIFPLAVAASLAAVEALKDKELNLARYVSLVSIAVYGVICFAGLLAYDARPIAAASGIVPKELYLRQRAPDYQAVEFVNASLKDTSPDRVALVFIRHVYGLNISYLYGDPIASWAVDPDHLQNKAQWKELFREHHIAWVVRNGVYPPALAESLENLEKSGLLSEISQTNLENFQGNRIFGVRTPERVVIFRVNEAAD
jgi:Protein of unknown function (DUF1420)/Dolichyl-phosphate-mannose-protein mannosyltransferase